MSVSVYVSKRPYVDHVLPVWDALGDLRGDFMAEPSVWQYCLSVGITPVQPHPCEAVIILSRADLPKCPKHTHLIFMEHGVGSNYGGKSHLPPNAGFDLILTTPAQAPAHRALYRGAVEVVGCPKLDNLPTRTENAKPVVAFSHHWEQRLLPETRSAWPWDAAGILSLADRGDITLIGHKHPGDTRAIGAWCIANGIEFVQSQREILERADCYICDNSSSIYEFAATDRPVVVLSPPHYRRTVNHGLRFWDAIPGIECSQPYALSACVTEALIDVPERREQRRRAVEAAYGTLDGKATERAVEAISRLLD